MSWETTDVLSADTTDVLSADTTDVLSADTTDVLSADTEKVCFGVGRVVLDPIFRENVAKSLCFTRFGSRRRTRKRMNRMKRMKRMNRIPAKWATAGSSDPRFSAPEFRMTVVMLHKLPQINTPWWVPMGTHF